MSTDELMIDEEMTPETLIDMGREWEEFLMNRMTAEQHLARVSKADILQMVNQDDEMRKDLVAHLPPEERLIGLKPEELIAGLRPEELPALMEQIERYLREHPVKPTPSSQA